MAELQNIIFDGTTYDLPPTVSSSGNTTIIKEQNGLLVILDTVTYTSVNFTEVEGSYYKATLGSSNFAESFITKPYINININDEYAALISGVNYTSTGITNMVIYRPVSSTNTEVVISYVVIGKWK